MTSINEPSLGASSSLGPAGFALALLRKPAASIVTEPVSGEEDNVFPTPCADDSLLRQLQRADYYASYTGHSQYILQCRIQLRLSAPVDLVVARAPLSVLEMIGAIDGTQVGGWTDPFLHAAPAKQMLPHSWDVESLKEQGHEALAERLQGAQVEAGTTVVVRGAGGDVGTMTVLASGGKRRRSAPAVTILVNGHGAADIDTRSPCSSLQPLPLRTWRRSLPLSNEELMSLAQLLVASVVDAVRREGNDLPGLSSAEHELAQQIVGGASAKAVARALGWSVSKVNNHTQSLFSKLRVSNRAAAGARLRDLGFKADVSNG